MVVPAADSVAAVLHVCPPLFDSSTSSVAEKVPEILIVVVPAFCGRTDSHKQLKDAVQFEDEALILPPWIGAAFCANRLPPIASISSEKHSTLSFMGLFLGSYG